MFNAFFALMFPHAVKPTHIVEYVPYTSKYIHVKFLRRQTNLLTRFAVVLNNVMSKDTDTAGCNSSNAGYAVNGGCFTSSIRSQKTKKLSGFYRKRNVVHRDSGVIGFAQIFYFECGNHNKSVTRIVDSSVRHISGNILLYFVTQIFKI